MPERDGHAEVLDTPARPKPFSTSGSPARPGPFSKALSVAMLMTRIPLPSPRVYDLSRAALYLPATGLFVWLVVAVAAVPAATLLSIPVAAAAAVLVVQYCGFNLFHFDGLLDSADALAYKADPSRRQAILTDHITGSFALFFGCLYIVTKVAILSWVVIPDGLALTAAGVTLQGVVATAVALAYPVTGRLTAGILPLISRPLRTAGLSSQFERYPLGLWIPGCLVTLLIAAAVLVGLAHFQATEGSLLATAVGDPGLSPAMLAVLPVAFCVPAFASAALVSRLFRRRIGGITGDGYGLAVEIGELAHLLGVAALLVH